MARIPTYDRQLTPNAFRQVGGAGPTAFGAGKGQALQNLASAVQQQFVQSQQVWASKAAADARVHWAEQMKEMQKAYRVEEGGEGFTQSFKTAYDGWAADALNTAPSGLARQMLAQDLQRMRPGMVESAINFEAIEHARHNVHTAQEAIRENANAVRADPSQMFDVLESHRDMIEGLGLDAATAERMDLEQTHATARAAIQGRVEQVEFVEDVRELLEELIAEGSHWKELLSNPDYHNALRQLESRMKQMIARDRQGVLDGLQDAIAGMEAGAPGELATFEQWNAQIDANIEDPAEAAQLKTRLARAYQMGTDVNRVTGMSYPEKLALADEYHRRTFEDAGEFRLDAADQERLATALRRDQEAFMHDPAGYVMATNSEAAKAFHALMEEGGATPENAAIYAELQRAEQRRLYPEEVAPLMPINLLPRGYVDGIANQRAQMPDNPAGAEQRAVFMSELRGVWGKHWPEVRQQLYTAGAITPLDNIAGLMMESGQNVAAQDLLRMSTLDRKELDIRVKSAGATVGDVEEYVMSELADFWDTMDHHLDGDIIYGEFREAVTLMTKVFVADRGMSARKAAKAAAAHIINDAFDFSGGTYRIPRSLDGNPVDTKAIHYGARQVLRNLDTHTNLVPMYAHGLDEELRHTATVNELRDKAAWRTRGDGRGLELAIQEDNGMWTAVLMGDENGNLRPLTFTFDELATFGAGRPAWYQRAATSSKERAERQQANISRPADSPLRRGTSLLDLFRGRGGGEQEDD